MFSCRITKKMIEKGDFDIYFLIRYPIAATYK